MDVTSPTHRQAADFGSTPFGDPAFDAHPGFDFGNIDEDLRSMRPDMESLNGFHHANTGFELPGQNIQSNTSYNFSPDELFPVGSEAFAPGMSSSIDPASMWADTNQMGGGTFVGMHATAGLPPSDQANIIRGRGGVTEQYGQITPPDNTPSDNGDRKSSLASASSSSKKLDKSERARNAANQRHAKSKKARQDNRDSKDDGSDSGEGKLEKYREKNRVAAAKCRAKKKENTDDLEVKHRSLSAAHSNLKRQERQLRDELCYFRTLALDHGPECVEIHAYNQLKASEIAVGLPGVSSPSDVDSPAARVMTRTPFQSTMQGPLVELFGKPQPTPDPVVESFGKPQQCPLPPPASYAFGPVTTQQDMTARYATAPASSSNSQQQGFSNFLQSSPEDRAGFS